MPSEKEMGGSGAGRGVLQPRWVGSPQEEDRFGKRSGELKRGTCLGDGVWRRALGVGRKKRERIVRPGSYGERASAAPFLSSRPTPNARRPTLRFSNLIRFNAALLFFIALFATSATSQTLIFSEFPRSEVFSDSAIKMSIMLLPPPQKAPVACSLYAANVPSGNKLAGHTARLAVTRGFNRDSTALEFTFKPQDNDSGKTGPQLGLGFHYLVAACNDGGLVAPEVPVWVVARQSVSITSPKALETSSSPTFAWSAVPGVPAYHLLLSDQAINIDADKGTVAGASIIWQAITTQTSIAYGTPDPSGNYAKLPAPPLSPGVPYNLVILNNYDGRSSLSTSSKSQGLKLFTIQPPAQPLKPPKNLLPVQNKILTVGVDSNITFRWTRAQATAGGAVANTYQLFIYSLETQDELDVLIPIWHTEVTDTSAVLDAKRTLLSRRYVWKVFALSETGAGTVGDTTSFTYRNDVQTLSITVRSSADNQPVGDVRIGVVPVDGSADALPLFSLNSGEAEKVLAVGGYALTFTKDGFLSATRNVTLSSTAPLEIEQALVPAACRITGHMLDATGADLVNVTVTATGGGRTVSAQSDAQGFFLLGVPAGGYAISFAKPDYQPRPDTTLALGAGNNTDLGRLTLAQAQGSLTGSVANDKGAPLSGCQVTVKTAGGAVLRTLLTDDKGVFSAFLAPGTYTVAASRTGFTGEQKTVQLTVAASLAFTLSSGASVVKGRISLLSWAVPSAPTSAPLAGAFLELVDRVRKTSQKGESDLRGEYSLSADTGLYLLRVSKPGKGLPDSALVHVAAARSTYVVDVSMQGFAAVLGVIHVSPDTVLNPAQVSVNLMNPVTLAVVASAVPSAVPAPGDSGAMAYSLNGVPDGTYRISCGVPGYGLDTEPTVTVKDALWKTGQDLTLKKANKILGFAFTASGKGVKGSVRILTPQSVDLPIAEKLQPAAAGTYTLDAFPDSAALIPLSRFAFFLPSAGAADTTLTLAFPFSHQPGPLTFTDGQAQLTLEAQARLDSVQVIYGYGAPVDTFRVPAAQLFGPSGPRTLKFKPGPQGGLLTYYFRIRSNGTLYSNEDAARRFQARVEPSRDLAILELASGDSLRLPSHTKGQLFLHAFDAAGRRLDSLVDADAEIHWQADSTLDLKLDKRSKRTLTYLSNGPTALFAKRSANGKTVVAARRAKTAIGDWDTLRVTVSLEGIEKSLSLPAKVVDAVINKLVLTSTLGEVDRLPAPGAFGLFATGFDTTITPPFPLVPNPAVTLDPPQAGTIAEMRASLHPGFIGPLRILARQLNTDGSEATTELGAYRDSAARGLNVGQTLLPGDTARLLFHDPRFEMTVGDSAFSDKSQAVLRLYRRGVAKSFASGFDYAVDGPLWEISNPSGASFSKRPRISVGVPSDGRSHKLKRFDAFKLDWKDPSDSVSRDTNSFGVAAFSVDLRDMDGSFYGLLGASRGLTAGEVQVIPNPFSPLVLASRDGNTQYGTRIRIHPESDRSPEVTVTAKIYTLDGELVRTLVDHKTVPKSPQDFYWDGKADGGRWARNGRYLLKVAVNATGSNDIRYTLKPVVVFR